MFMIDSQIIYDTETDRKLNVSFYKYFKKLRHPWE